jgi:hypothetical protein
MKTIALLTTVFTVAVFGQPPSDRPSDVSDPKPGTAQLTTAGRAALPAVSKERAATGALVQAVRVKNPIKLLDPRTEKGRDPNENLSLDPMTGRAQGIKLLSFTF